MEQEAVMALGQQAILTVLLVSAPALGFALLTGLIVSIFQATTQINEQTLSFVPKIVAVMVSLVIFGPWMLNVLLDFTINLFEDLHLLIR